MSDVENCSAAVQGVTLEDSRNSPAPQEGDHDSGVDENTQAKEPGRTKANLNGQKSNVKGLSVAKRTSSSPTSPSKGPLPTGPSKVPMNKIQVGCAPSPNLKTVTSKIGSMANAAYKPGGGNVKIETKKIQIDAKPRIGARNEGYVRSGGDKKIQTVKLQWNAQSKIGSLENAAYKPGGGDKKIESRKLDFKDKAKSKVGSTVNIKHAPGGGNVKIFDDKEYMKQRGDSRLSKTSSSKANSEGGLSGTQTPTTPDSESAEFAAEEAAVEEFADDLEPLAETHEPQAVAEDEDNDAIVVEMTTGEFETDGQSESQEEQNEDAAAPVGEDATQEE